MTAFVRAASLQGYEVLASSLGIDPIREMKRVGLSPTSLTIPDVPIPYVAQFHLLEHTAAASSCPDFGMRLSERQDMHMLGPLAILMRHAATLGEALQLAAQHVVIHSPAIRFSLAPVTGRRSEVDLVFEFEMEHLPPCPQSLELALGVITSVVRQLTQGRVRPLLAMLPHARIGPATNYARVFDCPCNFETPVTALRLPAHALVFPLPEHDLLMQLIAKSYLEQHFGAAEQMFADRVRMMVRRYLGTGQSSQTDIARMLSIHPRTMQRRLLDEGHHFEDIVDGVRKDQLADLLSRPQPPRLSQIALMLGYSEQAALTRSCHRWFGCTPTEFRESHPAPLELEVWQHRTPKP